MFSKVFSPTPRQGTSSPWPDFTELAKGGGFKIPLVEERGITVPQLGELLCFFEEKFCGNDAWRSQKGETLDSTTANLYDIVEYIVKPATKKKQCSYVEMVATSPQVPKWFVSHWWGQKVAEFIVCLLQHSSDRGLDENIAYWVCAYAAVQWTSEEAKDWVVPDYVNMYASNQWYDPESSPFQKAMRLANGTISIIDSKAYYFRRVWCCYEIWSALTRASSNSGDNKQDSYKYDIYTCIDEDQAVGITDGLAEVDMKRGQTWWTHNKYHREKKFPVELARCALTLKLERGICSQDTDRVHILNTIVGAKNLDATPPAAHVRYDQLNGTVGGRFAAAAWRRALETDQRMEEYAHALKASDLRKLWISFDNCTKPEPAKMLASGISSAMRELDLDFNSCTGLSDDGLTALAMALPCTIQKLKLDLSHCRISIEGMRALAKALQKQGTQEHEDDFVVVESAGPEPRKLAMEELSLSFAGCGTISEPAAVAIANSLPKTLKRLVLNFYGCIAVGDNFLEAVAPALPATLIYFELRVARCPDVSDGGVQVLATGLQAQMQHMVLDFRYATNLSITSATAIANNLPASLKHLEIDFVGCTNMNVKAEQILEAAVGKMSGVEFTFWGKDDFSVNM